MAVDAIYAVCEWLIKLANWAIKKGGDIDFVWSQLDKPTWTKDVLEFFQESPPLMSPFLLVAGIAALYFRRNSDSEAVPTDLSRFEPNVEESGWSPYWEQRKLFSMREVAFLWAGHNPAGAIYQGMPEYDIIEMFREHAKSGGLIGEFERYERNSPDIDKRIHRPVWREYANSITGGAGSKFPF